MSHLSERILLQNPSYFFTSESELSKWFDLKRCNGSFQTGTAQTVATVRVWFPFSRCTGPDGAGVIRCNAVPMRLGSKRTGPGREPEPEP